MLIRELEQNTGLERATIRYYEKEGFITPNREENGYRTYSEGDRETLLKIKLLRQLGMPLEMIRELQQGSEDFTAAVSAQILALEHRLSDTERAKEVCQELRDAGVTYESLDAAHYLHELTVVKPAKPTWEPQPVPEFRPVTMVHPWRRYFARTIDYLILNLLELFLLVAVLRIRPLNDPVYTWMGLAIVSYLLWIPLEAVLLHFWGTTPGKWIMGIRIESVNGGKLSIFAALGRAWSVLWGGYGMTVPIYEYWRLYRSYKDYVDQGFTPWDRESDAEPQFEYYYETHKKVLIGCVIAACMILFGFTMNDSVLPVHRGPDLTVAEFAENYNDYLETAYDDATPPAAMYLTETGCWEAADPFGGNGVIVIGSKAEGGISNFVYEVENGYIRSISWEQRWSDITALVPMGDRVQIMLMTVAVSQDWMTLPRYYTFADSLKQILREPEGNTRCQNLEISWDIDSENCIRSTGGMYFTEDNGKPAWVQIQFKLTIKDSE